MSWTHSAAFIGLLFALVAVVLADRRRGRRLRTLLGVWRMRPSRAREDLGTGLVAIAVLLIGLALAGPSRVGPRAAVPSTDAGKEARPLVVILDVSRSMTTRDVAPDRAAVARRLALRIATSPGAGAVAIVAFARDAYLALPPTSDRGLVSLYLGALDADAVSGQGSDLARAIDVAVHAITIQDRGPSRRRPRPGTVVLLSDGEGFQPADSLTAALGRARELGVVVHTITVGTASGAPVPGVAGARSVAHADVLANVARTTGGLALTWDDGAAVSRLESALHRTEPAAGTRPPRDPRGTPTWPAGAALLALLAETALRRPRIEEVA